MFFAPIEEVKIYRTGAVVRRKTSVSLKEGTNEIIISGLSNLADPDSLRLFFLPALSERMYRLFRLRKQSSVCRPRILTRK